MQHIVVMTARQVNLKANDWVVNGIGRKGTHLMDVLYIYLYESAPKGKMFYEQCFLLIGDVVSY